MRHSIALVIAAAVGVLALPLSAARAQVATLPTAVVGNGTQVTPVDALAYYGTMTSPARASNQDIDRLAKALGDDIDRIHAFVHDDVEMVWLFGLKAGARGALIDKAGTPIDQTHLFVELAREAGFTASYRWGTIAPTLAQMLALTGVSNQAALEKLLKDGGFPYEVFTQSGVTKVRMLHLWAQVTIGGTAYAFDPAFKTYTTPVAGLNIDAVSNFSPATLVGNATSVIVTETDNGTPRARNFNRSASMGHLQSSAVALQQAIATSLPDGDIKDVVGGRDIQPLAAGPVRVTALPYQVSVAATYAQGIPEKLRTKATVSFSYSGAPAPLSYDFWADEVYGIQLVFEPIPDKGGPLEPEKFSFTGGGVSTGWLTGTIPSPSVTVDHPYASPRPGEVTPGHYMDRTVNMGGGGISGSLQLMLGFGRPSKDLGAWQEPRNSPEEGQTVRYYGDESEPAPVSNQTAQRRRMAASYLAQLSEASELLGAVGDSVVQQHDVLGFVTSNYYPGALGPPAATNYHIGVETGVSATAFDGNATTTTAVLRTYALLVPSLEGSVAEQMGDSVYAVSTPMKLDWAVDGPDVTANRWFYYATSANWTWVKSQILNDLEAGSPVKAIAESYINNGYALIIPRSSNLGPGLEELTYCAAAGHFPLPDCDITGPERGGAFIAIHPDGRMAHIISRLYGMAKGGGGGDDAETVPGKVFAIPEDFRDRQYTSRAESYDVDLKTGALTYTAPPDLVVGNGAYPYSLSFQRTFRSGPDRAAPDPDAPYKPADPLFAESGWTSNLTHRATPSSDGMAAFGRDDPRTAASTIIAMRAMLSTSADGATPLETLERQIIANMASVWWTRTLLLNTVTIEQGPESQSFVRLANGTSWAPPRGQDLALQVQGTRRLIVPPIKGPEFWSYRNICVKLTGADRSISSFGPPEWTAPYVMGSCPTNLGSERPTGEALFPGLLFRRQTFPYGVQVDRTADGGLSNNLGRSLVVTGSPPSLGNFSFSVTDGEDSSRSAAFDNIGVGGGPGVGSAAYLSVTDAEGHEWNFGGVGFQAFAPTQPNRPFLSFAYRPGVAGAVETFTDANDNETQFYISSGRAGATEDPYGAISYVRYDEFGQPVLNINRLGEASRTAYDNHRRVIRVTQPEGNAEEYAYDARHNRTETRRKPKPGASPPPDIVTSATYHATFNVPVTETDARGATTDYSYQSGTGLLTEIKQPDAANPTGASRPTITFTWKNCPGTSCRGQRETKTDPTGIVLRYTYDADNYLATVTSAYNTAEAATTTFGYDAAGNIISLTDPRANVHTAEWDDLRRITRWAGPDGTGAETQWTYDADGLVTRIREATGRAAPNQWADTSLTYEPTARVSTATDPESRVTRFRYDALNRLTLTIDPEGRTTANVYDAEGRVIQERRGDGSPEAVAWITRTYTDNGRVATFADANPSTTGYVYDQFDRLIATQFPDPDTGDINTGDIEVLTYDVNDNVLTRTTRGGHVLTMDYDRLNRLIEKVVPAWGSTPARTAAYAYDQAGRQELVTETGGHELDWTYDAAGRPSNLAIEGPQWTGTKTIGWQYDKAGNRTRLTWPDSYYVTYTYDALNRLDTATQVVGGNPTLLADYTYDPRSQQTGAAFEVASAGGTVGAIFSQAGNLTSVDHDWASGGGVTVTYSYDLSHRLLNETFSDANYRWALGGAHTDTYSPDHLNRYIRADGDQSVDMTYDGNHNLATWGAFAYTHDPENRMTRAQRPAMLANYLYDPLGRRVKKTASGGINESYLLDGDEEIAEYDSTGALVRRFIPSNATDAPIAMVTAAGVRSYFRINRQGTVMAMTSSAGALVEGPFQYGPYGEPDAADISSSGVPFRYTGRRYDPETGLYYYRARYYHPDHGRFIETDPIGYEGGANLYAYVDNSPPNDVDPSGTAPLDSRIGEENTYRSARDSTKRRERPGERFVVDPSKGTSKERERLAAGVETVFEATDRKPDPLNGPVHFEVSQEGSYTTEGGQIGIDMQRAEKYTGVDGKRHTPTVERKVAHEVGHHDDFSEGERGIVRDVENPTMRKIDPSSVDRDPMSVPDDPKRKP